MDFCDTQGLMSLKQAMTKLLTGVVAVKERESVGMATALGRVLAEDVRSALNVPPHDNSGMDGYALRAADLNDGASLLNDSASLQLIGQSLAGHPFNDEIGYGECVRIMTGATIPPGADTVIMQERTKSDGNSIAFTIKATIGDNIRCCGEDIAVNDVVLKQGRKLGAADLGLLASLGIKTVTVCREVKVALFSTGDELKHSGERLNYGEIYESNRSAVTAMLTRLGTRVIDFGIIPDDKDQLRVVFNQANEQADIVLSSGGVSVGDADYTKDILEELGQIGFWKLAIKPGKPFAFGRLSDSHFIGLPGNPVSAMVTFHQLAIPFIRKVMGQGDFSSLRFNAKIDVQLRKKPGRTDFQRGIYRLENGQPRVTTTGAQGSGILSSMSAGNCYIIVEQDRGNVEAGETVTIELFDGVISG